MLFVDGENLAIRAKEFARSKSIQLNAGPHYDEDVFVWLPGTEGRANFFGGRAPLQLQTMAIRSYYYTSTVGDDARIRSVIEALWKIGFQGAVFKRKAGTTKSKGVDIALAKDFLCNAFYNNFDVAVLLAGDGDYVPMVNEVKRMGKAVYVIFFRGFGLSENLRLASDEFFELNDSFASAWAAGARPASGP